MTDSRKEFEEWCYINWNFWITVRKGDGYENEDVNNMWRGWKGGRQSVAKGERTAFEQAKLQEEVEELRQKLAERDALLKEKDARTVGDIKLAEQLIPHDPDNGVYGDCYRATLATLLGLDTEQVPHFLHDNCDVHTFNTRVNEYLAQFGLVYMSFNAWDIPQWKKDAGITIPIYHEIGDDSPRFSGTGHSVVGCDGEVFHDPHPTKLGLPKVTETRTLGFLVQASPNARDKIITELREALAKTLPSEALERVLVAERGKYPLHLGAEDLGIVFDGLMLERDNSLLRKAMNPESNSDQIANRCTGIMDKIRAHCAAEAIRSMK